MGGEGEGRGGGGGGGGGATLYRPIAFDLSIGNDDVFTDHLKKYKAAIKPSLM